MRSNKRPYIQKSIAELEAMFESSRGDAGITRKIEHELGFRSTNRAKKLNAKIANTRTHDDLFDVTDAVEPLALSESPAPEFLHDQVVPAKDADQVIEMATRSEVGPKPTIENHPSDVLKAWTALEVLSPRSFRTISDLAGGDRGRIAKLDADPLPWERNEKSRPNKRLYFELILGTLDLGGAVDLLLKVYSDNRPERPSKSGKSPIASIMLDKEGRPLEDEASFTISSFAWGLPVALRGDLTELANWPRVEFELNKAFEKQLIRRDQDGEILPIRRNDITRLFNFLIERLGLKGFESTPPSIALRHFHFFAAKVPPEPQLLNSFYLQDLGHARTLADAGKLPNALSHYLGERTPGSQTDLLVDERGLREILQPNATALGRWPGPGRFPLALLQQAAVNATNASIHETNLLAVNGPPGTGKTTLLRDVVAARIVERAQAMMKFSDPAKAFSETKQTLQRNGARIALHRIDKSLKGYEMIVASSNNKAVENVSAELPMIGAVADDAETLRYFSSVSDNLLGTETWGAVSAVLGNSNNRYKVSQDFWRDEERGFSTYLNHASGTLQIVAEKGSDGKLITRPRAVVALEDPPNGKQEAMKRWKTARANFKTAIEAAEQTRTTLHMVHELLASLDEARSELLSLEEHRPQLEQELEALGGQRSVADKEFDAARKTFASFEALFLDLKTMRPGFWARLFGTARAKAWRREMSDLVQKHADHKQTRDVCEKRVDTLLTDEQSAQQRLDDTTAKIAAMQSECHNIESQLADVRTKLSIDIPDDQFFERTHEEKQTSNVWYDTVGNTERDNVFEAAIKLHRAFIDCAADPLRQNLAVFIESFGTRSLGTKDKNDLIPDLWASFFLVVPVVSTTFASVHAMFSRLPNESLGWLLVDEAGQALPQAAVGAMLRTKNSMVVGDPLQIEPVVTLPNTLTQEICGYFGIDHFKFNAPTASTQTLADAASPFCARFPAGSGHRDVGLPLLVHRRCDSPMFEVSNEIAYAGFMVQAKQPSTDEHPLGFSQWHAVSGQPGPDKWCEAEADHLGSLLQTMRDSGAEADLYIVTPFRVVQNNLRQYLQRSGVLDGWVANPNEWVKERVGTVHTVQGREARTVFFVLGAQLPSQDGSRSWAGRNPNLVNVAVTRAKASLHVVGNRDLWKSAGYFSTVDRLIT